MFEKAHIFVRLSGIHTGAVVVELLAHASQSKQQVFAITLEHGDTGVVPVEALMGFQIGGR
jgi:hypothetical protein